MTPRFFRSAAELRKWLTANHDKVDELMIGFYKKDSGRKGISYKEALDEALCFGWIDGVRRGIDEGCYCQRFTPRRARSIWSRVNIKRYGELEALGRVRAAGRAAFARRDEKHSGVYSYENQREHAELGPALEKRFRANARAWAYFRSRPPGYQRLCIWYVASAKKDETRLRRLDHVIEYSARELPIPGLDRRPASQRGADPGRR